MSGPEALPARDQSLRRRVNLAIVALQGKQPPMKTPLVLQVPEWVGSKPRLLVINRSDAVSAADRRAWTAHFAAEGIRAYWTDGKLGAGTALLRAKVRGRPKLQA